MNSFKAARRATSLLHWKVDPEIYPLVGAMTFGGMIVAANLYSSRASYMRSLVSEESHLDIKERSSKELKVKLDPSKVTKIGTSLGLKEN